MTPLLAGVQVETGVALVGVLGQREVGVELDDRHGQHRGAECTPDPTARCGDRYLARDPERPPSVDRLARALAAASGLPHAICVDLARAAIAEPGRPHTASTAADARAPSTSRRTLLPPVVNATGVLLHTNLGRAPFGVHAAGAGA